MSRERPILMSAPMVRALLSGAKTQTRRVVKPQPLGGAPTLLEHLLPHQRWATDEAEEEHVWKCPYGEPGDRLWVRETFCTMIVNDWPNPVGPIGYRADGNLEHNPGCWRPSIHMARRHSRITLEITGVRVERLQEISEADARAEGAPPGHPSIDRVSREFGFADFPRSWYGQMWEQINGRGSWAANPFVWVLEFRKLEQA